MSLSQTTGARQGVTRTTSQTIVERIAEAEGVEPTALGACLYDSIDPEALNDLVAHWDTENATDGVISFEFHGYRITVQSDKTVEIDPV